MFGNLVTVVPDFAFYMCRFWDTHPENKMIGARIHSTATALSLLLGPGGLGTRMVVTGDVTQVDLPHHQLSGLEEASEVLDGVAGVAVCRLTSADVVRHPLVQRVVEAYARLDEQRLEQREEQGLTRPSSRIVRR